jgi:hypothetical protein
MLGICANCNTRLENLLAAATAALGRAAVAVKKGDDPRTIAMDLLGAQSELRIRAAQFLEPLRVGTGKPLPRGRRRKPAAEADDLGGEPGGAA